jgi:hypothetical protein
LVQIGLVATSLVALPGCAAAVRSAASEAPRRAVPVAIDESLKAGEDEQTRQRLARILATPEIQAAIADAVRVAVRAAFDETSTEASERRIGELTRVVTAALAEDMSDHLVPAAVAGVRRSVDRKELEAGVTALVAAATTTALREAAREIPSSVGPATRESLVRELRSPELREAMSGLVGAAAREVVDAMRSDVETANQAGGAGLMVKAGRLVTLSWLLPTGLGVLCVVIFVALLHAWSRIRHYKHALADGPH